MDDGVLPHHKEYEEGIIGAILNDHDYYGEVSGTLKHTDFYLERHQRIYRVMGEMFVGGIPVNIVTLWERLRGSDELEELGGSAYLTYLSEMAFLDDRLDYYVDTVREDARRRRVWELCIEGARAIETGKDETEIINRLSEPDLSPRSGSLDSISVYDLDTLTPPESLWADIIYPGCIVQLNSEPGVGKSTLAYNICALGATGKPFLDIAFSKRLKSLYVDLETPKFLRRNKVELICGELPKEFHLLEHLDLRTDFNNLLTLCKRERYDLVVLDTQSRVLAMEKENDNSEANYLAGLLRRIANEAGCAILLIHHSTKGDDGKAVYRGRGASAIAGAVDVVVNVDVLSDDVLKLAVVKHRIQGSNPSLFIKKTGGDRFERCEITETGEDTGFLIYRVQDEVMSILTETGGQLRAGEIIEMVQSRLDVSRRMVERALGRLAQAGKIHKPRRGYYDLRGAHSDNPTVPTPMTPGGSVGMSENGKYDLPDLLR